MTQDTVLTIKGNLTADPQLTYSPRGDAVVNFTVASTPRFFHRATNEWRDGEPLFMQCSQWRQAAENLAESLTRGARVIVTGRLKQRSFTTREGEQRTVVELDVDEVGPSLRYATAQVTRNPSGQYGSADTGRRDSGTVNGRGFGRASTTGPASAGDPVDTSAQDEPWATPALAGVGAGSFGGTDDPGF
ncbi:single-strand DNA-binding protein [Nocardia sp. GAS34]|uniref:single-stranded DNA-binding protein n=1 Tax=unclassified Nocardia TaxID=2637762 RepID=UPI003D1D6A5E